MVTSKKIESDVRRLLKPEYKKAYNFELIFDLVFYVFLVKFACYNSAPLF